jgi:hypothetical protein
MFFTFSFFLKDAFGTLLVLVSHFFRAEVILHNQNISHARSVKVYPHNRTTICTAILKMSVHELLVNINREDKQVPLTVERVHSHDRKAGGSYCR